MGKAELKIEIDAALLAQARAAGLDLAGLTEAAVRQALGPAGVEERAAQWIEENAEGIADYNRRIRERGLIGAEFRKW